MLVTKGAERSVVLLRSICSISNSGFFYAADIADLQVTFMLTEEYRYGWLK
jgi:hypothetical protein